MATLAARLTLFAQAVAADVKALYIRSVPAGGTVGQSLVKTGAGDYAVGWQTPAATGATIDDTTAAANKVYSSTKTNAQIATAVAGLVNSSPAALDTLKEFADALGNDANFAATTTTALGNRVRFDAAQVLTTAQQIQARANIAAYGDVEIGNPDTDLVALYTTAKA